MNDKTLQIVIKAQDQASKVMSQVGDRIEAVGSKMRDIGKSMTAMVTLPIVAGFGLAIKAASDLNETLNKVDVAFGDQAKNVKDWSKTSIKSMGLAQQSALDAASLFGDMSTSMGLNTDEAAKMSKGLTQLGGDLASFKNIQFSEAQTALAGVFTGETESLKRLGIVMTEVNLLEFAKRQGITKTIQEMTQAEKVQLRYNYILSVTKNAQGDFIRTSDGAANQTRMTGERVKQLAADIGEKLLPIYIKLLEVGNKVITWFQSLSTEQQNAMLIIAGVVAAIGPLLIAFGSIVTALGGVGTAVGTVSTAYVGLSTLIGTPLIVPAIVITAALIAIKELLGWWNKLQNDAQTGKDAVITAAQQADNATRQSFSNITSNANKAAAAVKKAGGSGGAQINAYTATFTQGPGINKSKFATGGFTGRGSTNEVAGIVHKGEYVIPQSGVNQSTGLPNIKSGGDSIFNMYGTISLNDASAVDRYFDRINAQKELGGLGVGV